MYYKIVEGFFSFSSLGDGEEGGCGYVIFNLFFNLVWAAIALNSQNKLCIVYAFSLFCDEVICVIGCHFTLERAERFAYCILHILMRSCLSVLESLFL